MTPGVGFSSENKQKKGGNQNKKKTSTALVVAGILLLVTAGIWFYLKREYDNALAKVDSLEREIATINKQLSSALSEEASDFATRSIIVGDKIYKGYEVNDIFNEIEKNLIKTEVGNRVVLQSFQYDAPSKNNTGVTPGKVAIAANADTLEVMAQQIDVFKKSDYFDNIKLSTTDRDDMGRVTFSISMNIAKSDNIPYETAGAKNDVVPEPVFMVEDGNVDGIVIEENDETQNQENNTQNEQVIVNGEE